MNTVHRPSRRSPLAAAALAAAGFWPLAAKADFQWNFPPPVTPLARDTLDIHNEFMIIITVLFVAVFAVLVYSLARHRKSIGHEAKSFTGPRGPLQWLWVLVPFAIMLFIDFVLMGIQIGRASCRERV